MNREQEIAWAAGIWEGEGCWNAFRRPTGKMQVQSRLAMSDADVIDRFAAIVGFGTVRPRSQLKAHPDWKPMFEWYTQRRDSTARLIEMFWPYLGERRRAKAQELLDLGPSRPLNERMHCPKGHPYSGDNLFTEPINRNGRTYYARRCRICRRAGSRERARERLGIPAEKWRVTD